MDECSYADYDDVEPRSMIFLGRHCVTIASKMLYRSIIDDDASHTRGKLTLVSSEGQFTTNASLPSV